MSLPQSTTPPPDPTPVDPAPEAPVESVSTEPDPVLVDDPTTSVDEAASDADLRAWAKDNGIEDVPASGRLSATWREQILAAQAAAAAPVVEEETVVDSTDQSTPDSTDEETPVEVEEVKPTGPEWETGVYRSVFQAPNTFIVNQEHVTWQ
jgi:hypothetical protein